MARLAAPASSSSRANTVDSLYRTPSVAPPERSRLSTAQSSPGSSDKENYQSRAAAIKSGKMPASDSSSRGPKRRRLADRDEAIQYVSSPSKDDGDEDEDEEESDGATQEEDFRNQERLAAEVGFRYGPHQTMEERRELRKNYRELDKEMQDSRSEWMAPSSTALQDAVIKQNLLFGSVKQTSEATIDSRMLVSAGDIAHKRTKKLNVGESAQGIDLEEFVGKCISYMGHDFSQEEEDDNGENQGDSLDWGALGSRACFPFNSRPPTIGFLLGPLAVQKKVRQPTQRKARAKNASSNVELVKAKELKASDLENQENSGLAAICLEVKKHLNLAWNDGHDLVKDFFDKMDNREINSEQQRDFENYIWILGDGGVSFFKFAIHPTDFGQSVENLFYISFLIRDDHLKIEFDSESGMPSIHELEENIRSDRHRVKDTRNQAVFALDFETWEGIVKEFHITQPMIPDRSAQNRATQQPNAHGWYG